MHTGHGKHTQVGIHMHNAGLTPHAPRVARARTGAHNSYRTHTSRALTPGAPWLQSQGPCSGRDLRLPAQGHPRLSLPACGHSRRQPG